MQVAWLGKSMDARTQIRSIFRNMLKIEDAADGRLPPQGAAGGVSELAPRFFELFILQRRVIPACGLAKYLPAHRNQVLAWPPRCPQFCYSAIRCHAGPD
jgi:hypothetical protein